MAPGHRWATFNASMRNLQKAYARQKELGAPAALAQQRGKPHDQAISVVVAYEPRQREAILSGLG